MHVVAVNGSPRKDFNSAALLRHSVEGAQSVGATAETVHLYDFQYKGCISCFACKRKDNPGRGCCAVLDDLSPVLRKVMESDVLLLASPIYLGDVTGMMRSFLERLIFAVTSYDDFGGTVFDGHISSAFFFTMNMPEAFASRYTEMLENNVQRLHRLGGRFHWMASFDTYQFDDYFKYTADMFDVVHKEKNRAEQFPADCRNAFEIGAKLASRQ